MKRVLVSVSAVLLLSTFCWPQNGVVKPKCSDQPSALGDLVNSRLPMGAKLDQMLPVKFSGNQGETEIALVYSIAPRSENDWQTATLEVWKCGESGWRSVYKSVNDRMGAHDQLRIEKVSSKSGPEAIVVISHYEGAGTATSWDLLARIHDKLTRIQSDRLVQSSLASRGYVFNGYNGVKVEGNLIIDELAGYSAHTARCCPDLPSIRLTFQFTGAKLNLDSVRTFGEAPTQ
jgi:hypothetical protein